jgi:hypothetical protein
MKQLIILAIIMLALGQLNYAQDGPSNMPQQPAPKVLTVQDRLTPGAELHNFDFSTIDSTVKNIYKVSEGKNLVVMLFNPTCDHCYKQAYKFIRNIKNFSNTQFVLLTGDAMQPYYLEFCLNAGYSKEPEVIIAFDTFGETPFIFAEKGIPQIMAYGIDKKLRKVFYKEADVEEVLQALSTEEVTQSNKKTKRNKK